MGRSSNELTKSRRAAFRPALCALVGAVIGFAVIHPLTMLMNHDLLGIPTHPDGWFATVTEVVHDSFTSTHGWVWGGGYAVLSGLIGFLFGAVKTREQALRSANAALATEKERSDRLLLNILPPSVAEELKHQGQSPPRKFPHVTILFADIVGFSRIAPRIPPEQLIHELNDLFTGFDHLMEQHGCERLKTIGDAYLAVCGMPTADPAHATKVVQAALAMIDFLATRNRSAELKWQIRIGVHSGAVMGGVVGVKKYLYDIFGDAVNCAARLQQHGAPMRVNVSESTRRLLGRAFVLEERGAVETKEGRALPMYFVTGLAPSARPALAQ